MELNEREKNIVDLIGKLADAASDESTTQETIDHIMENLQSKAQENAQAEMTAAEKPDMPMPKVKFPEVNLENELKKAVVKKEHCNCNHNKASSPFIFTRIREVKAPCKAHPTDAGIDFFVPDEKAWDEDFRKKVIEFSRANSNKEYERGAVWFSGGNRLWVEPGAHVAIPSGIKTIIPPGLGMMFVNKSGVATKLKLDHSACLVDSEYRDEIIMCFFNHNTKSVEIEPGMKITQGLIVPIIQVQMQEVLNCVYDDIGKASDRGGGFGSSGGK
jgi:deoxyuridine 5'-triphosphate nucleotidohydrolase